MRCIFMKKRSLVVLLVFLVLTVIISAVFATEGISYQSSRGVKTKDRDQNIPLYPPEITTFSNPYSRFAYIDASKYSKATDGFARVNTDASLSKQWSSVEIKVNNMPKIKYNEIYEAWLIDVDSGYKLTLGMFTVDNGGDGKLLWSANLYLTEYDKIAITKESLPDRNPTPSGNVILVGDINVDSLIKNRISYGKDVSKEVYAEIGGSSAPGYVKRTYAYSTN